jgi:hypothetical protein
MKATKIEIENSVIRILENGPWLVSRKLENDGAKYADFTGQLVEDIHEEGLTAKAIHAGMDMFRKQWTFQRWPVTGELLAYLKQGQAVLTPRESIEKKDPPLPEKWARQMLRSQTGARALAQGWHYELHMWATRHPGKTPQDDDIARMIDAERTGRERIGQVRANHRNMFCGESLLVMAEAIDRKKAELLDEYRPVRAAE